jgi:hypothetical protein
MKDVRSYRQEVRSKKQDAGTFIIVPRLLSSQAFKIANQKSTLENLPFTLHIEHFKLKMPRRLYAIS